MGDRCPSADAVNTVSFKRAARFASPMLWLYGDNDPFYKISHSKSNFDAFTQAGGRGNFRVFDAGNMQNGHGIISQPDLWRSAMEEYLQQLGM